MFAKELSDEMLSRVFGGVVEYPDVCSDYKNTAVGLPISDGKVVYPPCPYPEKKGKIAFCNDCICNRS